MNLRDVLDTPVLKRALEAGEERMGKVVAGVLASERITTGLQRLVGSALQAKETFDRGVEQALHAASEGAAVPVVQDAGIRSPCDYRPQLRHGFDGRFAARTFGIGASFR